jgi:hypothetical protein
MTAAVPGTLRRDARPPITTDAAPAPDAAAVIYLRPTVRPRPLIRPVLVPGCAGHRPDDPAVRRFWTAAIGPSAVADLLRLIAAARVGAVIREPLRLALLAGEGLCRRGGRVVLVGDHVPFLGERQLRRIHPGLRGEYRSLASG